MFTIRILISISFGNQPTPPPEPPPPAPHVRKVEEWDRPVPAGYKDWWDYYESFGGA